MPEGDAEVDHTVTLTVSSLARNFSTLDSYSTLDIGSDVRCSLAPDFRSGTNQKLRPRSGGKSKGTNGGSGLDFDEYDLEASLASRPIPRAAFSKKKLLQSASTSDTRMRKAAVQRSFHAGNDSFATLTRSPKKSGTKAKKAIRSSWSFDTDDPASNPHNSPPTFPRHKTNPSSFRTAGAPTNTRSAGPSPKSTHTGTH